jgi:hypothetical protein
MSNTASSRKVAWLALAVTLVVGSIAGAVGTELGRKASGALFGESSAGVLARPWPSVEVAGLRLLAPDEFRANELQMSAEDQAAVQAMVHEFETFQSGAGPVEVMVSRAIYKADVQVSLEGAAEGAVSRSARAVGSADHAHEMSWTEVSGVPAIRTSATFSVEGRQGRTESLTFSRSQELWQIQTVFPASPNAEAIAQRLLESVSILR